MHLKKPSQILEIWQYAMRQGANVVLIRHGPKAGDDRSDLTEEGQRLTEEYGKILTKLSIAPNQILPFATSKSRTVATLKGLFPNSDPGKYLKLPELDTVVVTPEVQKNTNNLHAEMGHWRGYTVSQTFHYLEKYSGRDGGQLHSEVIGRVANGIKKLFYYQPFEYFKLIIYCGHSPQTEAAVSRVTGIDLTELGGFLNPLSSIHLRMRYDRIEFVARVDPIIGYIDIESETYYAQT